MASSWERLATVTLGSAGDTLTSGTFTAKKYLKFTYMLIRDSNDINDNIHFNDETDDGNYSMRRNFNGGDEGTFNGENPSNGYGFYYGTVDSSPLIYGSGNIMNVSDKEKIGILHGVASGTAGGGNAPSLRRENAFKWSNTSVQITKITLTNNIAGSYGSGSTLTVWGADDQGSTTTAKDKSSITNVPAGTRYEEVDTRKIFHSRVQTGGAASGNVWVEKGSAVSAAMRGVFGGGQPNCDDIDYFTIQTLGNASDFGNLTEDREFPSAFADATRGIFGAGGDPRTDVIDYITVATTGNATDFGDILGVDRRELAGLADATRGCICGGTGNSNTYTDAINYITIQTTGDAQDFGNLQGNLGAMSACADATRGIVAGGFRSNASGSIDVIDYFTIQTLGNSSDFGNLVANNYALGACADATRGIIGGGNAGVITNVIQYITIQTTGNTTDFGDLTIAKQGTNWCADSTRGVCGGGYNAGEGGHQNVMEYITIQTTGNGTDFGDLLVSKAARGGLAA